MAKKNITLFNIYDMQQLGFSKSLISKLIKYLCLKKAGKGKPAGILLLPYKIY